MSDNHTDSGSTPTPDEIPAEGFDQTNGLAPGLDGDSDGTARSDEESAADRADSADDEAVDSVAEREVRTMGAVDDIQPERY